MAVCPSRQLCSEHGTPDVQVQSGVARTGKWWGHQHFEDAAPDIMLFAKGIGSGYPFAGIAAKPHLYDNLKPGTMGALSSPCGWGPRPGPRPGLGQGCRQSHPGV